MWLPAQHKELDARRHAESSATYQRNSKKLLPPRQQRRSVHAHTPKGLVGLFRIPTELKWQQKVPELPQQLLQNAVV